MANTIIVELGINDTLQDVIRKVNSNFKRMSTSQSRQTQSEIRQEASRTDNAIAGVLGEVRAEIANGLQQIDNKVEQTINDKLDRVETKLEKLTEEYEERLQDKFDELEKELKKSTAPAVGTYIMCDYDPNKQWPGTVWTKLSDITEIPTWKREE